MIDWNKPIRSKKGEKLLFVKKLYNNEAFHMLTIVTMENREFIRFYREDGHCISKLVPSVHDAENIPKEVFTYINVYKESGKLYAGFVTETKEITDMEADIGRVGRIKVKLEERFDD